MRAQLKYKTENGQVRRQGKGKGRGRRSARPKTERRGERGGGRRREEVGAESWAGPHEGGRESRTTAVTDCGCAHVAAGALLPSRVWRRPPLTCNSPLPHVHLLRHQCRDPSSPPASFFLLFLCSLFFVFFIFVFSPFSLLWNSVNKEHNLNFV